MPQEINRLIDLRHTSKIDRMAQALRALGRRLKQAAVLIERAPFPFTLLSPQLAAGLPSGRSEQRCIGDPDAGGLELFVGDLL